MSSNQLQFLRQLNLLVSTKSGKALDLSKLRIKFSVKRSGVMTPNVASIRVYNMDLQSAATIKKEYTSVVLQAGYASNYGVIFNGTIKQCILGRENATDTFLDIFAGDADIAYNYAVVNSSLAAGSSLQDQLNTAMKALNDMGTTTGYQSQLPMTKLPRGKVLYGNARDAIQAISLANDASWSIQDGKTVFLKVDQYMPGEVVVLTSKTGMIGTPQQTVQGINLKCLLNPKLKVHGRVKVDNASIAQYQLDFSVPGSAANTPVPITADGVYYIFVAEHSGDTRSTEWYTNLVLITIDPSNNPLNNGGVSLN